MITPQEACTLVRNELPELSGSLPSDNNVYETLEAVQAFACQKTKEQDYKCLQQCFSVAAQLYQSGSSTVRCAVENVFVYAISRMYSLAAEQRSRLKALIPDPLKSLYRAQVLHYGY